MRKTYKLYYGSCNGMIRAPFIRKDIRYFESGSEKIIDCITTKEICNIDDIKKEINNLLHSNKLAIIDNIKLEEDQSEAILLGGFNFFGQFKKDFFEKYALVPTPTDAQKRLNHYNNITKWKGKINYLFASLFDAIPEPFNVALEGIENRNKFFKVSPRYKRALLLCEKMILDKIKVEEKYQEDYIRLGECLFEGLTLNSHDFINNYDDDEKTNILLKRYGMIHHQKASHED